MQHLQMKADDDCITTDATRSYDNSMSSCNNKRNKSSPAEAQQMKTQANDILAQFSAPIMTELMLQFLAKIGMTGDEDPLVTIRKQELALKGQQLNQDQQQF